MTVCRFCGKEFDGHIEGRKNRGKYYCSRNCYLKSDGWKESRRKGGIAAPHIKKIRSKFCVICGKMFTNHSVGVFGDAWNKRKYCSKKCMYEHRREIAEMSHDEMISNEKDLYEGMGYRVLIVDKVRPDIIAIKGEEIIAVELETGSNCGCDYDKYNKVDNMYDKIKWVTKKDLLNRDLWGDLDV